MKILIVLPRFPWPLEKGDKLRAYHQIVQLATRHEVYLFALSHQGVTEQQLAALRPYCRQIHVVRLNTMVAAANIVCYYFRSRPLQLGYWFSKRARREYLRFEEQVQPDVVYNQMVRTIPMVYRSTRPRVMDFQDCLSLNMQRRMEQSRGPMRRLLRYEFKRLRSTEYDAFSLFDALTIISRPDAEAVPSRRNSEIVIVPNGVDTDYFCPGKSPATDCRPATVLFCGNMAYAPNVDAARYLVLEVMPLVWQKCPEATVLLAGASPKPAVRALAGPRVTVSGYLPDIRAAYAAAKVFVAPMRIGTGLQNKLLEAMSMGLPCVTTPLANASLGAVDGRDVLVGETPAQLADAIVRLVSDGAALSGRQFVEGHYSWSAATSILEQVLVEVSGRNDQSV